MPLCLFLDFKNVWKNMELWSPYLRYLDLDFSLNIEWWKNKMYTHIIDLNDELCDILEDDIDISINGF